MLVTGGVNVYPSEIEAALLGVEDLEGKAVRVIEQT